MKKLICITMASSIMAFAIPAHAQLDMSKPIINFMQVEPNSDIDGLKKRIARIQVISDRLELNVGFRLFEAWFSGDTSGQIYLLMEAPDVRTFFEAEIGLNGSSDFREILNEMGDAGQEIPFEALYSQVSP